MASRVFGFFTPSDSSLVRNWLVCREPRARPTPLPGTNCIRASEAVGQRSLIVFGANDMALKRLSPHWERDRFDAFSNYEPTKWAGGFGC